MKRMFLLLLLSCSLAAVADTRGDSIYIFHYDLSVSIRNLSSKTISGTALLRCVPKVNGVQQITLDFLKLPVSAVTVNGVSQVYTKNDSMLFITFGQIRNTTDTIDLQISYSGQPQTDPQWGGFYFSGNYAYNMGVGFVLNPHNFGRCWFPCFDNFTQRSTYDVHVTTDSGYKAVCGGLLQSAVTNPDHSTTWSWSLKTPVPTYLVSVAVSTYEFLTSTYAGINRNIPVLLAAHSADTTKLKNSFQHLPNALGAFESHYGPYQFERVGYAVVPFNSGAMEHACNIAYPLYAVDGTLNNETLYAHELSHHWWGDLATCRTAGDMWLNEGWASYSEKLFLESLYGKPSYRAEVKSNHLDVLRYAHIKDGDFRAVTGIPHQYTYGEHVYHKGADMVHTLRSFMGDSAFFAACHSYLNQYMFKDVSTDDLKNHFQPFTTADLGSFFNDWINHKGFCDFRIASIQTNAGNTKVEVIQDLRSAPDYYTNVPLTLTFYDAGWNTIVKSFTMSGRSKTLDFALPFQPVFAVIDQDEQISYARSKNTVVLKTTGLNSLEDALMDITVTSVTDSALVHVEHHWAGADQSKCTIPGLYVSNYRYWKVDGIWPAFFKATAFLRYDGTTPSTINSGYLDHTLIKKTEDSLVLVWRPDGASNWQVLPDSIALKQAGDVNDKTGRFWVKDLRKGEYALAMFDIRLAVPTAESTMEKQVVIYPNPAKDLLKIAFAFPHRKGRISIYDLSGKEVDAHEFSDMQDFITFNVSALKKGNYLVRFDDGTYKVTKKLWME